MYKIISLDVDGTLLNSKKEITENTLDTLLDIQKKGVKLVIATGRFPYGVRDIAGKLQLERFGGYIIGCNGALAVSAAEPEKPLFNKYFPRECLPEICEIIKGREVGISCYQGNSIVVGNFLTKYILCNAHMLGTFCEFKEDFPQYVDFPVHKVLLSGEPDVISELEKIISQRFEENVSVFRSESFLLEIVKSGVNKGEALKYIAGVLGIRLENCIAFGDNDNDVAMISCAGTGVAMSNATVKVKAAADIIAPSNDSDGVARIIKIFC